MSKAEKKRNWAAVIYPDSLPSDWKQILIETGLPIAISPLHDRDYNESTGEPKKAHYHIILCYSGPTTFNVVNNLMERLKAPIPIPIESVKGAYRYFTHQDNPEKAQYDNKDIQLLNGFNIVDFVELTKSEVNTICREIFDLIDINSIIEYSDIVDLIRAQGTPEQFDVVTSHTMLFHSYLTSKRHKKGTPNLETGNSNKETAVNQNND